MSEPTPGTIELTCPGCQAYFRLKPKQGKFPKGPIPCPKCQTAIPLHIPKGDVSSPGKPAQPAQSGVITRNKIKKGPSTNPAQPSVPTMVADQKKKTRESESVESAFLRAADQLLDHPEQSPTSTFQGFGIAANLRRTSPSAQVPPKADEASSNKNSTTDTSHFHREDPTKSIDRASIRKLQEANKNDTPVGGIDVMNTETPVGGVNPLSVPGMSEDPFDSDEPGPFDMRDILEAERHKLEGSDPNEATHNPLLGGESAIKSPSKPDFKPLPDDHLGAEPSLGATETLASEDDANLDPFAASSDPPIMDDEPLVSRSDIFTDASATAPSEPEQDDLEEEGSPKADSSPSKSSKPLAAMLRKKFGSQKLEDLRSTLNEPSITGTMVGLPSASEIEERGFADHSPSIQVGADEDDLAKILDEADSKRPSGEHQKLTNQAQEPHQHPTKPALLVNEELSKRLASITPPTLSGDSDASQDPVPEPSAESIGARFRKRIQQDRSPDLEPGQPPGVKGSSLLAKLKPNRVPASDITGNIPIARHLQSEQGLPDEASLFNDDAESGSFRRFDITPQRGEDSPSGISWATSDSVASSAAFQDHAQNAPRKRRRQESHSGLFPISGGIGQEDSLGIASERKGSGYIRLPTSEIIDVLGKGQYRLLVEDIVYEPVDERGLTELVKRGVILGAEKIAEPGGEWRPINEHPVFRRLKKKMAIEAHALLAKYRRPGAAEESSFIGEDPASTKPQQEEEVVDLPASKREEERATVNTLATQDFSNPTPSVIERLDDLSAELDEEPLVEDLAHSPPSIPATAQLHAVEPALPDEPDPISEAIEQAEEVPAQEQPEEVIAPPEEVFAEDAISNQPPVALADVSPDLIEDEDPLIQKKRSPWLPVAGLLLLGGLIIAGVLYTQPELRNQLFGTSTTPDLTDTPVAANNGTAQAPTLEADALAVPKAIGAATDAVREATSIDLGDRATQLELARGFAADGEPALANALYALAWSPSADKALSQSYADSLIAEKDYAQLRQFAMTGLASGEHTDFYEALRKQALEQDESLRSLSFVQISKTSHGDSMALINSGRGLVFKMVDAQGQAWAFHPEQKGYTRDAWHREVTAWRLCQLIVCGIKIPEVSPATLSAKTFDFLMSKQDGGAAPPSERYGSLAWSGAGDERKIEGTLKRWVEPGAYWPFGYTNTWRPWLAAYEDAANMNEPLDKALGNMLRSDEDLYKAIMSQNSGMSTGQLAKHLSQAITFDFLTNNMNRFRERTAYNGALDNQLADGRFYSLDHATIMNARLSSRVKGRFDWVQRFDRAMIESIRALDPEVSSAILFPEGTQISRGEQQAFWSRRTKLLKEVDASVAKYGKENVLYFE